MWKFIKRSIFINILLFIFAALVLYGALGMVKQAVEFWREAENSRLQIRGLTQKKEELERYLEEIRTPQVIEREAKERLNLKLPGEEVVVVPEERPREPVADPRGFLKRIKPPFLK